MVLPIRELVNTAAQVFLPRRYSDVVTDTDIEQINSNAVFLHLVFRGLPVSDRDGMHIFFHFITMLETFKDIP